jgi:Cd2+/Zn2+-exporting ATPase
VVEVVPLGDHDEREVLERAAAMEARSDHPLARAILAHARARGVPIVPADDLQVLPGRGAAARFGGQAFWVGSRRYLQERGQETEDVRRSLASLSGPGRTVVAVGTDHHVCGLIALADAVRPEARRAVDGLRKAGVEAVVLLTGDTRWTAEAVARETGVDTFRAELLPADKVEAMDELIEHYGEVAMAGDGVNDAPAMARAALGVAMGTAGSDAALETADVALMADDLSKLPWLVGHARDALAILRQNVAVALLVKAAFMALAIAGYATLWSAIAADMGASLLVTFNGLRLLHSVPPGVDEAPAP